MKKPNPKQKKEQRKTVEQNMYLWICIFVLFFVAVLNIVGSQTISHLYFGIVNEEKDKTITYLTQIKALPEFKEELKKYKNKYGEEEVIDEVYKDDLQLQKKENELKRLNSYNPKSRDILFALYRVYKDKGDLQNTKHYRQILETIDPEIVNFL